MEILNCAFITSYERDKETDLDFAQARMYGYGLGRFTSPDPLMASAKRNDPQTLNRYVYVGNNPLIYVDPNGKEKLYKAEGNKWGLDRTNDDIRIVKKSEISKVEKSFKDPTSKKSLEAFGKVIATGSYGVYKTTDEAANAWGQTNNPNSIKKGKEFASSIYELKIDGKTVITYTEPNIGKKDENTVPLPPTGTTEVAIIHSHGKYLKDYKNNEFSSEDKQLNDDLKVPGYVTTPNGSLQKYDPSTKNVTEVNSSQPSDPKDPDRKNKIN